VKNGHHHILRTDRTSLSKRQDVHIKKYNPSLQESFSALHQMAFPNTYYSSEQIISRINEENQLFIIQNHEEIKGYVYVEAIPLHGEGAIEYIAVWPHFRGQGIATKLMKAALHHLFSYEGIEEIQLSVEANNKAANDLYMGAGFQIKHTLISYKK